MNRTGGALLTRNLRANALGQAWTAWMGLAFVPVYLKYLGTEGYGLVGFLALLQAWLSILDLCIGQTLNRAMARAGVGAQHGRALELRALLRSCELVCGLCAILFAAAICWQADWLARHWVEVSAMSSQDARQAIALMGIAVALRMFEGMYRGAIIGSQQHVALNAIGAFVATWRWAGAAAVLAGLQAGVVGFFLWQALTSLVAAAVYAAMLYHLLPPSTSLTGWSLRPLVDVASFSSGLLATAALALVLTQADKLVLSHQLSLLAFGGYSVAVLASNAIYQLVGPITQAYSPRLAGLVASGDLAALRATYHQGAQLLAMVLAPAALMLVVFPQEVLHAWTLDAQLAQAMAPTLSLLAMGTLLNGLMGLPHMLQLAHGWPWLAVRVNALAACAYVPALVLVADKFGTVGAAMLWVALHAASMLAGIHWMHKRLLVGEENRWYWKDVGPPTLAAGAVLLCSAALQPEHLERTMQIVWLVATAASAFCASALACSQVRDRLRGLSW